VCGLSVQRTTLSQHVRGTFTGGSSEATDLLDEGALLVQCLFCGHGGHVAHVHQWWQQYASCPVGTCKCECRYA
jgi:hypothetical protein